MEPSWVTAFVDLPADEHERGLAFWRSVTGCSVSPPRGEHGEFVTLLPPAGDAYLKVQRIDGPARIHLDLHVPDVPAMTRHAVDLGATLEPETGVSDDGYAVLVSPAGLVLCLVTEEAGAAPAPVTWPDGHTSRVDQVCLDVPPGDFDREVDFWSALTGWPPRRSSTDSEYVRLAVPTRQPLRLLLQRLAKPSDQVGAHLDVAASDPPAEVDRILDLGAERGHRGSVWTALEPPVGPALCVVERDPVTGGRPQAQPA